VADGDFEMVQGDTKRLNYTVKDKHGDVVNITGATIRWWLADKDWKTNSEAVVHLHKTTNDDVTISGSSAGLFTVDLFTADTENLQGTYYHEAEVVLPNGDVGTVDQAKVKIKAGLIKPSGISP
jgi:hypothetical protein